MRKLRKALKIIGISLLVLLLIYVSGPTPALPTFAENLPAVQGTLPEIAQRLAEREQKVPFLKPDNQARIVWADSTNPAQTEFCVVYLHGFFASYGEGFPTHLALAKHYKANFVCNRMTGHGVSDKDSFLQTTPENMWASAQEALAIAQRIGKRVILVGTSTGGSLALLLASKYPKAIEALVLYSPLIDFYEKPIWLLYKPWGLQIATLLNRSPYITQTYNAKARQYWTSEYRLEGAVALTNLIANTMHIRTFEKIKLPVFVGAYYKDAEHQDMVVSVKAMQGMFAQLSTPTAKKKMVLFPEAGHHVISSDFRARQVKKVIAATIDFLETAIK